MSPDTFENKSRYYPDPPTQYFVGRSKTPSLIQSEFQTLHEKKVQSQVSSISNHGGNILILQGPGGIGKSEIARKFVCDSVSSKVYSPHSVAWINVGGIKSNYNNVYSATCFKREINDLVAKPFKILAPQNRRCLIVLDEVESSSVLTLCLSFIIESNFKVPPDVLITRRSSEEALSLSLQFRKIELEPFSESETIEYVQRLIMTVNEHNEGTDSTDISKNLKCLHNFTNGLPAAIKMSTNFILKISGEDPTEFFKNLQDFVDNFDRSKEVRNGLEYTFTLDFVISEIKKRIMTDKSGLGPAALSLLESLVYLHGDRLSEEFAHSVITVETGNQKSMEFTKETTKQILQFLQDFSLVHSKKDRNENSEEFQMFSIPCVVQDYFHKSHWSSSDFSSLIRLAKNLKAINKDCGRCHFSASHVIQVHRHLKARSWPADSIEFSSYFALQFIAYEEEDFIPEMLEDVVQFLTKNEGFLTMAQEVELLAVRMGKIYQDTILQSRKVLQPSQSVEIRKNQGEIVRVRLDEYGGWILEQLKIYEKVACDSLVLISIATLERLQKHKRFCTPPKDKESTLEWIVSYRGEMWYNFQIYAALSCGPDDQEWLAKLCRSYIKKFCEELEKGDESEIHLKNVYLCWVCLRDLVKKSRIQSAMIEALTEKAGLEFLFKNFEQCQSTIDSPDYYVKYRGQTVIETCAPLVVHGNVENVEKLVATSEFWRFLHLILVKHPFSASRYNFDLENDLICACEVVLDFLIATCKFEKVPEGFISSFLTDDFVPILKSAFQPATAFNEKRQEHTCKFYFFTVLFTLFSHINDESVHLLVLEQIQDEIQVFLQEEELQVSSGCLRDYKDPLVKYLEKDGNLQQNENVHNLNSRMNEYAVNLVKKMLAIPQKYEWESDTE